MDQGIATFVRHGETAAHANLKRLAVLWAQAHRYSACAVEVKPPRCRYRADVAAYRPQQKGIGCPAIFECKQARADLRKDNYLSVVSRVRLETVYRRQQILEKNLRIHYRTLRGGNSLFPEWESHERCPEGATRRSLGNFRRVLRRHEQIMSGHFDRLRQVED